MIIPRRARAESSNVLVVQADTHDLSLADASVDLIVTSPPYFALRSYTDGGEHYAGQIGSEPTPAEFLEALWACTAEWMRVLKPSGSIWVNLGDKYAGGNNGPHGGTAKNTDLNRSMGPTGLYSKYPAERWGGIPSKSLMCLPWRYAIGCIDRLGLILRAEVVLDKKNGLPESVTDRVRRSHEQVFHFVKQPRYFSALDEIRDGYAPATASRYALGYNPRKLDDQRPSVNTKLGGQQYGENPLGKLPGSVWPYVSEPLRIPDHLGVDHFAAFPTELPRRIIQGWSPAGICMICGEGRQPTHNATRMIGDEVLMGGIYGPDGKMRSATGRRHLERTERMSTGYTCACRVPCAPTRPAVVLDPFGGTGTTALTASMLGRIGISMDLSYDYSRLARWRTTDATHRAKMQKSWQRRDAKRIKANTET